MIKEISARQAELSKYKLLKKELGDTDRMLAQEEKNRENFEK